MIRRRSKGLLFVYLALIFAFLGSQFYLPILSQSENILNSVFLMLLFTLSWFFVHLGIQKNPKRFIFNFMIMTVMQFLTFLTFELVLVIQHASRTQVIHALVLCIILLVIQSISLVQSSKS